jgi:hypothetical protein
MVDKQEGRWVVPNPQVARTFGVMNIVFGGFLLLVGAAYIAMWVVSPYFSKQVIARIAQEQAAEKARRESKIAELKRQEAAAKTEDEKESLQSERESLEKVVEPDMREIMEVSTGIVYSDIRLTIYYFGEAGVGMLLNLIMLVSGAGLLGLTEWARRLAVWVAWAKIVRWVAMVILTLVLVLPITMPKVQKAFDKMTSIQVQAGKGAGTGPMLNVAQLSAIGGAIAVVFSAVIASIYPALSIWFLTRPETRAAMAKPRSVPLLPGDGPGEPA